MKVESKTKQTEIGIIPDDWEVKALGEMISIKHGYAFKGKYFTDIPNKNILLTPGNFHIGGGFKSDKLKYYIGNFPEEYILKENDLIVTMTDLSKEGDTLGYSALIPTSNAKRFLHNQRLGLVILKSKDIDKNFLYWVLRTRNYHTFVVNTSSGSTVKHTAPVRIYEYKLGLPTSIKEQQSIANILSNLDDKIELNRKINYTLGEIGQAIFKRWFIDFEFQNEKGKPYKASGGEMVDSDLGEIPKGWTVGRLGDICDITMGQSPPGKTYNETGDGLPFYQGIVDFGFRFPSRRVYCTEPTRFAERDDVLLSVRAPVGSLNMAEERCAIGRGLAALRLKEKHGGFLYYLLRATQSGWEKFEAEGTVFGSVTKSDVHDFKVVIPPKPLRDRFTSLIGPIDEAISNNEKQSRALMGIRDSLLPRLMSGRIRVKTEILS